uniref:Uncharacterized protein n=1 Tax=Rhipicephalus zambeziensis TaxID=60191 RepID=A0A224Y7H8_9ACAR
MTTTTVPPRARRNRAVALTRAVARVHRCHWLCLSRATPTVRAAFAAAALARAYSRETRVSERAGTARRARAARRQAMLEARRERRRCCTQVESESGRLVPDFRFPRKSPPSEDDMVVLLLRGAKSGTKVGGARLGTLRRQSRARLAPLDLAAAGESLRDRLAVPPLRFPPYFSHHAGEVTLQRDRTTSSPLAAAHRAKSHGRFG